MDSRAFTPETSASLLLRIRNPDDRESWKTFERIYGDIINTYCAYWQLQPEDAEDVTQDVMAKVSQAIRSFEYDPAKGRFRSWLGMITFNKIKRLRERKAKRRETSLQNAAANDDVRIWCDPDTYWVELFSVKVLKEALRIIRSEFEEKTWTCFQLTWQEKVPPAEVARQFDLSVHAVYVNKSRVLKRLEHEIRNLADDLAFDA